MIAQLQSGQAFLERDTRTPFILKTEYDYSSFGSETLQRQAKDALSQFLGFVRHTFVSGLEIGRSFRHLLHQLCLEHGLAQGERLFDRWLDSSDFGGSTWMARALIQISEWFDSQHQRIQKLILNSVQSWSVSALKELTKIDDDHLLVKLLKAGKQTVNSIRQARSKSITLGQPVTDSDWELVAQTFDAPEDAIDTLKAEAERLAHVNANPLVLTDYLIEAISDLSDWDTSKLLAPKRQVKPTQQTQAIASFIANSASPTDAIDDERLSWIERGLGLNEAESEQFRSCVQNLARQDAPEEGEVIRQHRHVQQALKLQKLAPVTAQPQQSDRMVELEKQVRDLTAQLKEADKAAALINGLQAQRDRLERENLKLQELIQESAQKDLRIHLLERQLEEFERSQSDSVLEQLAEQNQQLLIQLEEMQQRYESLASEMAAKERSMKYTDNSTLVAKVMTLEAQLAEANDMEERERLFRENQRLAQQLEELSAEPAEPQSHPELETYKSMLVAMATAVPFSAIAAGDRALVVKPNHPAMGELVAVVSDPNPSELVVVETDSGKRWNLSVYDLRLEAMLGENGLELLSETFAVAATKQQIPGWSEKGYRSPYGLLYRGWEAIVKFTQAILEADTVAPAEKPDCPTDLVRWMETVRATAQGQG